MSIIRIKHDKNFTVMNKICLHDNRLSGKAKGIYAYLMSLPDNWSIKMNEIIKHFTDGKTSLLSGIKELIKFGYCEHIINRDKNGTIISRDYLIREVPQLDLGYLDQGSLDMDSQPLLKNNKTKERINKKNCKQLPVSKKPVKMSIDEIQLKISEGKTQYELAKLLYDKMSELDPGIKEPNLSKWAKVFQTMNFVDGRNYEEIRGIIEWIFSESEFWQGCITTPYQIKAKYNLLRHQRITRKKTNNKNAFKEARRKFKEKNKTTIINLQNFCEHK